jgi:hypothetical protein
VAHAERVVLGVVVVLGPFEHVRLRVVRLFPPKLQRHCALDGLAALQVGDAAEEGALWLPPEADGVKGIVVLAVGAAAGLIASEGRA